MEGNALASDVPEQVQQTPSTGIPGTELWCSSTAETQRASSTAENNESFLEDPSRCLLDDFDMVGGTDDRQSAMLQHWMKRVQAYRDSLSEVDAGGREEVKCYAGRIVREYTGLQEKILAHYIMQHRGSTQQRVKRPKRRLKRSSPRQRFSLASCLRPQATR